MSFSLPGNIRILRRKSLVGQLVLLALAVELLIFASFTSFSVPTATKHNLERFINQTIKQELVYLPRDKQQLVLNRFPVLSQPVPPIRTSKYVPLCAAAVFVGYVLGVPLGLMATGIFLLIGLLGPKMGFLPFAAGGGLDYYVQPSFGYLIGLLFGAWLSARLTETATTSLRQLGAVFGGLFLIHAIGLVYLFGSSFFLIMLKGESAYFDWQPWLFESIRNFSWYPLPYDCLLSLSLVGLGFPFRYINSMLTAPDSTLRVKPKWDHQLEPVS
jgi:biotin transport system substrate-specific component